MNLDPALDRVLAGAVHDGCAETAAVLRDLINTVVRVAPCEPGDDDGHRQWAEATELLRRAAAALGPRPPGIAQSATREAAARRFHTLNPLSGSLNPIAPVVAFEVVDDGADYPRVRGQLAFGPAYEGPPGGVHGGTIAGTLDNVLGVLNDAAGVGGVTGRIAVRFHALTPLDTPLQVEARVHGLEGRKVRCWAGLSHEETLTAEAEAIFVRPRPAPGAPVV